MNYIFGVGGNATAIFGLMLDLSIEVSGFIADNSDQKEFHNLKVISTDSVMEKNLEFSCVVSVGENFARENIVKRLESQLGERVKFPTLIHPTSYVSKLSIVGRGSVLFPGAKVGPNSRIGEFVHLNTNSSIDHDCNIADFCSLAPGAVTGGNVRLGKKTAILLNAAISNGINVSDDVVIGATSFLRTNTGNCEIWAGSPATLRKNRSDNDSYL
ncbi:WbbJ Acetyltransferase (isoleucine patch superfamily) [Candidatus Nanopelagicaceae bacterium]